MKRLLVYSLLSMLATGGFAQSTKDTLLTITRDTLDKNKASISIKIGDDKDDEDDEKDSKPASKVTFQFIAARFDLGLSTYTDKGSYTLSAANSYLERETW